MLRRWHPLLLAAIVSCAGPAASPRTPPGAMAVPAPQPTGPASAGSAAPPVSTAATTVGVAPGMTPAEVRRALGSPARAETIASSTAPGARYERWTYPGREVVFLDGKVVDVVSW